jgi:hypothetical protein
MRLLTANNNDQVVVASDKENGGIGNASATQIGHLRMTG